MNENHVLQDDLQILNNAILSSPKNLVIAQLNLEFPKTFPVAQFRIPGYEIKARKDRNKYWGGLIEFVSSVKEFKNLKCSHMNLFVQN